MKRFVILHFFCCLFFSCGTKNAAQTLSPMTEEEQGKQAMNDRNYPLAIAKLSAVIEATPERYDLYPLLASAYAASAGVDLLSIISKQLEQSKGESKTVLDLLGDYVPKDPTNDDLEAIAKAVTQLNAMPDSERTSETSYGSSATFQLTLYQAVAAAMNMNRFLDQTLSSGKFSPEKLASMSDADVDAILGNLEGVATTAGDNAQSESVKTSVDATLAKVDAQPGASRKEKLQNYMASKGQSLR